MKIEQSARKYQRECAEAISSAYKRGITRQFVWMPTGSGKSFIIRNIPSIVDMASVLVMADTIELISQLSEHMSKGNPGVSVGIEQAENEARGDDLIVVASMQTLSMEKAKRLKEMDPNRFDIIIIDEAIKTPCKSYQEILKHFTPKLLIGFCATMKRRDKLVLADHYDEIVFTKTIPELWREGDIEGDGPYLSDIRPVRATTDIDISDIGVIGEDFNEEELALRLDVDQRNTQIFSTIEQHAKDRNSILVFGCSKKHVENLYHQAIKRGHHSVDYILGETKDRANKLKKFADGHTRIMFNCNVFIRGVDVPRIDCIVMTKPSMSYDYTNQVIGRGFRPFPGKKDLLIIDMCDTIGNLPVLSVSDMFGVPGLNLDGCSIKEKVEVIEKAELLLVDMAPGDTIEEVEKRVKIVEQLALKTGTIKTNIELVDLFSASGLQRSKYYESLYSWIKVKQDKYILPLNDKKITLERNRMGVWVCSDGASIAEKKTRGKDVPWRWVDLRVKHQSNGQWQRKQRTCKLRQKRATPGQVQALKNNGIIVPPDLTFGIAIDVLDYLKAVRSGI